MNSLIDKMLERRGLSYEDYRRLDDPSHPDLAGIDDACSLLRTAHLHGDFVTVMPDFDTDGVMSGVVGYCGLAELGFHVGINVPKPDRGYGITRADVDDALRQYPYTRVILTCDVGITCHDAIDYMRSLGLTVIVTDHHHLDADGRLPNAHAIVDPMLPSDPYPHKGICGAHVLWQVIWHYATKTAPCSVGSLEQIRRLRVFAGIGTIGDRMPVLYENRELIRDMNGFFGLLWTGVESDDWGARLIEEASMRNGALTPCGNAFAGLRRVLATLANKGAMKDNKGLADEETVGYYVSPMVNAVKRLNGDMNYAFRMFLAENDPQPYVDTVVGFNDRRKELVNGAMRDIQTGGGERLGGHVMVRQDGAGLLGLIANKVMDSDDPRVHLAPGPVIVVREDGHGGYRGSGRSPLWYDCLDSLRGAGFDANGHQHAFGVNVPSRDELQRMSDFLDMSVRSVFDYKRRATPEVFAGRKPDIILSEFDDDQSDGPIDLAMLHQFRHDVKAFKPFGQEFEPPRLQVRFDALHATSRTMTEGRHLKVILPYGLIGICWNQGDKEWMLRNAREDDPWESRVCTITGELVESEFRGKRYLEIVGDIACEGRDLV